MAQILLLTKNILTEHNLQHRLQALNHEVYCTSESLRKLQTTMDHSLLHHFDIVILSETLCYDEVASICSLLKELPIDLFQVVEQIPKEDTSVTLEIQKKWLKKEATLEELRESLVTNKRIPSTTQKDKLPRSMLIHLSRLESELLKALFEAKGRIVPRNELSKILWQEEPTLSNKSQLSALVNRLKRKFEMSGFKEEAIVTYWGNGYQLSSKLHDELSRYDNIWD